MKGIVLAGGSGTRLHPLTLATSKQLLPVYDKPMIYYPISVLMLAGIREILVITTPEHRPYFEALLGDGHKFGLDLSYAEQPSPNGLPEAFIIGADFVGDDGVALALGDNIFYGAGFSKILQDAAHDLHGCVVFGKPVNDPERHGIGELDEFGRLIGVEEKPDKPKSNLAITGLYFFDSRVVAIAQSLKPGRRGELEIVDTIREYIHLGKAKLVNLGRGFAWLDTGTHESMLDAAKYIQVVAEEQGLRIACLEEIALRMGYITAPECRALGMEHADSEYGQYIIDVVDRFDSERKTEVR